MKNTLLKIAFALGLVASALIGFKVGYPQVETQVLGAISVPDAPYLFQTTLRSAVGTTDTSMTLVGGTLKDSSALTGYQCFTLDTGTASAEYACGTASGTAISALVRGINPLNPTATSSALTFSHRRGADVRITDFPILQIIKRLNNGQDAFPNPLTYDSGVSTTTLQSNGQYLASINYVNGVSVAGAANATTTAKGILQFATGAQVSSGTMQGSTGAFLVAPNWIFNSTAGSATTVPVTGSNGKLAQGFIDLSQAFTFTGAVTFNSATTTLNATTTIAASASNKLRLNGVAYVFPTVQGSASTTLINDGSGNLTWAAPPSGVDGSTSVSVNSGSTSGSFSVDDGNVITITLPKAQKVMMCFSGSIGFTQNGQMQSHNIAFNIDSGTITGGYGMSQNTYPGSTFNMSNCAISGSLTAASHTFKMRYTGNYSAGAATNTNLAGTLYVYAIN